jgi:general secretion pathway protein H
VKVLPIKEKKKLVIGKKSNLTGFTLLELLIVLVLIGIIASFTLLATGDFGHAKSLEAVAWEFKEKIELAKTYAMQLPSYLELNINEKGYEFYRVSDEERKRMAFNKKSPWVFHAWPKDFQILKFNKNIIISPDGEMSIFSLQFKLSKNEMIEITNQENGVLHINKFKYPSHLQ